MIVSIPAFAPVTNPLPSTTAWLLAVVHTPPLTLSRSSTLKPMHTLSTPVICDTCGVGFTVMATPSAVVPQLFVRLYLTESAPGMIPVTMPVDGELAETTTPTPALTLQ